MSSKITLEQLLPKLDSLARSIQRIESKFPFTIKELQNNDDLQDIISINLERSIQQAMGIASMILSKSSVPIPLSMSESVLSL